MPRLLSQGLQGILQRGKHTAAQFVKYLESFTQAQTCSFGFVLTVSLQLESTYGVREALFIGVADRKRSASVGSQLEGSPRRTPRGVSELDNLKISEPLGRDGCGRDCCGDICATQ